MGKPGRHKSGLIGAGIVLAGLVAGMGEVLAAAPVESRAPVVLAQWGGTGWGSQPQQEDPNVRINELEGRVRQLTGQIEQLQFQIRRLEDQLKRFQEDTEFRFQEQQGGNAGAQAPASPRRGAPPARAPGNQQRGDVNGPENSAPLALTPQSGNAAVAGGRAGSNGQPPLGAPPQVLGQLQADPRTGQPIDLAAAGAAGAVQSGFASPPPVPSSPREAYSAAYNYMLRGEYDRAEVAFQAYLANFPGDRQTGDALYWLGETQFQRQQWKPAAESFLKSYNDYPNGTKAPESLLKLGMSLRQLGQKEPACATFAEVLRKYPHASAAVKQRVQSESRGASC